MNRKKKCVHGPGIRRTDIHHPYLPVSHCVDVPDFHKSTSESITDLIP